MLSLPKRAELLESIRAHLPPGVNILTKVVGFNPSRSRYLLLGLPLTAFGSLTIALTVTWVRATEAPNPLQASLAQVAPWLGLLGMAAVSVGIVKLVGWFFWKPEGVGTRLIREKGLEDSLWTQFLLQKTGAATPGTKRFAYSAKHQSFNFQRQQTIAWVGIGIVLLFFVACFVGMLVEEPKNPKVSLVAALLALGCMSLAFVGFLVALTLSWANGLRRILPHVDIVVVQTNEGLFVEREGKYLAAKIVTPARQHVQSRDSSGLNSASAELEVEGMRIWIDPISLRRIDHQAPEGIGLLPQQRPDSR